MGTRKTKLKSRNFNGAEAVRPPPPAGLFGGLLAFDGDGWIHGAGRLGASVRDRVVRSLDSPAEGLLRQIEKRATRRTEPLARIFMLPWRMKEDLERLRIRLAVLERQVGRAERSSRKKPSPAASAKASR